MLVVRQLIWDAWNVAYIARHNVTPGEVEEICQAASHTEAAKKGRFRATGSTRKGRIISVFLDPEPEEGVYYAVSARDASKKERRAYKAWGEKKEQVA